MMVALHVGKNVNITVNSVAFYPEHYGSQWLQNANLCISNSFLPGNIWYFLCNNQQWRLQNVKLPIAINFMLILN